METSQKTILEMSPRGMAQMAELYQEIRDDDDVTLTAWQRNMRVNAFMTQIGM